MWHIDRVSLTWSISDVLIGEDGTQTFNTIDTFRDSVKVTIKQPPLVAVGVMGTVSWNQANRGFIPLEPAIYTSLLYGVSASWPAPLTSLGSGWTITYSISGETPNLNNVSNQNYSFTWRNADTNHQDGDVMSVTIESNIGSNPTGGKITFMQIGVNDPFAVDIEGDPAPVNTPAITIYSKPLVQNTSVTFGGALILEYEASRQRTERLSFILASDVQPIITDPLITQDTEYLNINGDDVGTPILQLLNWTAVANSDVSLGQLVFPDDPALPGQTSTQICTTAGHTGSVEPIFSNVAGVTTPDGTAVWTSLGDTQPSETAPDWPAFTQMPLGAMILPRVPNSLPWSFLEIQGAVQNPPTGFNVGLGQVVLAPSGDYWVCILSGMTTGALGLIGTQPPGTVFIDGDAEWGCIGLTLPPGNVYWICTTAGVTGRILPPFNPTLGSVTNDGTAKWTSIGSADVPIGGYPGNTPATSYWPTVRAQQSIAYLIALARARLRLRSRAVEVSFDCRFERAIQLSCRQNAVVFDPRLPGGSAAGKIIAYKISINGDTQELIGNVTIGCAVGQHSSVVITPGTPTYVNGYVNGYQVYTGTVVPVGDDVGYTPPVYAPYDDGLTFPLSKSQAVIESGLVGQTNQSAQITQTVFAALAALGQVPTGSTPFQYFQFIANANADLQSRLNAVFVNYPVFYKLGLNPVQNGPFAGFYSMGTTSLVIPELINLAGPSTP
jgi:hypothetical protein